MVRLSLLDLPLDTNLYSGISPMLEVNKNAISRVLEMARRKLLETGMRNRLIHVNRANQRANCLNVINERSDDIFSLLRGQGKRMRFEAMGKDKSEEGQDNMPSLASNDSEVGAERYGDGHATTTSWLRIQIKQRRLFGLSLPLGHEPNACLTNCAASRCVKL
jgi:hypothetical protein